MATKKSKWKKSNDSGNHREIGFRFIRIEDKPIPYYDNYEIFEDVNKKEFGKYVKEIKMAMRKCYEYKELMKFLKNECGMDHCGIHPNISIENGFKIETHHSPFVAEQIIATVLRKRHACNESIHVTEVVFEIMFLHYCGIIGLYPLDDMCHHYYHFDEEDTLFIPNNKVFGDPEKFFESYKEFMTDALILKWENSEQLTAANELIEKTAKNGGIPEALIRQNVYVHDENGNGYVSVQKLLNFVEDLGVLKK